MTRFSAKLGLVLASLLLTAGCHTGAINHGNNTNAILTSNNYRVLETGLRGSDTGFRVFGIGANPQYSKAMEKIRILAELEDRPRALVNFTEDYNTYNLGIVSGGTIVVTADLVEFTGPPNGN